MHVGSVLVGVALPAAALEAADSALAPAFLGKVKQHGLTVLVGIKCSSVAEKKTSRQLLPFLTRRQPNRQRRSPGTMA